MKVHDNKRTSICVLAVTVLLSVFAVVVASADRAEAQTTFSDATITSATIDPKTGWVTIEGTVVCGFDQEIKSLDPVVVIQKQGNRIVYGSDDTMLLNCSTEQPSSFIVQMRAFDLETTTPARFHPGRATVIAATFRGDRDPLFGPIEVRLEPSRSV